MLLSHVVAEEDGFYVMNDVDNTQNPVADANNAPATDETPATTDAPAAEGESTETPAEGESKETPSEETPAAE